MRKFDPLRQYGTVEAETLEEALDKAIETANADDAWRSTGHCSDTFVDAVCEGADADPGTRTWHGRSRTGSPSAASRRSSR